MNLPVIKIDMYMSTEQIFPLSSLRIFLNVKGIKPKNT